MSVKPKAENYPDGSPRDNKAWRKAADEILRLQKNDLEEAELFLQQLAEKKDETS